MGNSVDITRRQSVEEDKAFARETHHLVYRGVIERQFGQWDEARQDEFFEDDWNATSHEILECGGEPCGFLSIENHEKAVYIHQLVIHPDYQGHGMGTAILRNAIEVGVSRGVPVKLETLHKNKALKLYERLGFRIYKRTVTHTQM